MVAALVSRLPTAATLGLSSVRVEGIELVPMTPVEALERLGPGDAAIGRLDVLPTLDGVDDGLWALGVLAARGVRVLNGPAFLLATHDKLLTARLLRRAGLPHPRTRVVRGSRVPPALETPVVVKPRHGSWGRGVTLCRDDAELAAELVRIQEEPWFVQHGALVQDLVPPVGHDLRLLVAGNRVVGCIRRVAPEGEWRTNVALGARRERAAAPPVAIRMALDAARAVDATLVGVDLLPTEDGWTIIELNGAVEFNGEYRPQGDVFREAALELVATLAADREAPTGEIEPVPA